MKNFKFFGLAAIAILLSAFTLTACSDDDDNKTVNSPIVGTWSYGDEETITFYANGTYKWSWEDEYEDGYEMGTFAVSGSNLTTIITGWYYYDDETDKYVLYTEEKYPQTEEYTYEIEDGVLTLTKSDGDTYEFYKGK